MGDGHTLPTTLLTNLLTTYNTYNKHKFVQKVAKKNILLISFEFSTK